MSMSIMACFKFQSDSINTITLPDATRTAISLNSNLILLIRGRRQAVVEGNFFFKFQSDSINTAVDVLTTAINAYFKFQSDSINTGENNRCAYVSSL